MDIIRITKTSLWRADHVSAMGHIASIICGHELPTDHAVYWIGFVVILLAVVAVSFGGTRKIAKVTGQNTLVFLCCIY